MNEMNKNLDIQDYDIKRDNSGERASSGATSSGVDNGRAVAEGAIRGLVGERAEGVGVYRALQAASSAYRRDIVTSEEYSASEWSRYLVRLGETLENSAKEHGAWIDNYREIVDRPIGSGVESEVYLSKEGGTVIKLNNFSVLWRGYGYRQFLDRLLAHNELFTSVRYTIRGFTKIDDRVHIILEQPLIEGGQKATLDQIESHLRDRGFQEAIRSEECPVWTNGTYDVWDITPENVLLGADGQLHFIDAIVNHTVQSTC
jgi:hypothetical protein